MTTQHIPSITDVLRAYGFLRHRVYETPLEHAPALDEITLEFGDRPTRFYARHGRPFKVADSTGREAASASYGDLKAAALAAGALGAGISGSGPSVFALARGEATAKAAGAAARAAFAARGTAADFWTCAVASGGPRILLEE